MPNNLAITADWACGPETVILLRHLFGGAEQNILHLFVGNLVEPTEWIRAAESAAGTKRQIKSIWTSMLIVSSVGASS